MKSDLIILRYKTEGVIGTKSDIEPKTYFGSKMVDIEDEIYINDGEIQYSDIQYTNTNTDGINNDAIKFNGYQFLTTNILEQKSLIQLNDIKDKYSSITLLAQSAIDLNINTQWQINIDWIGVLTEYIFYKLKEARTFKCIRYNDVLNENINNFILEYINKNILNRYSISDVEFFIKYLPLDSGDSETSQPNLLFDPKFDIDINSSDNFIKNINSTITTDGLLVTYKQTEDSTLYKFNYYYNFKLTKI